MQRYVSTNRSKQRPEWDSTYGERENYALTPSELVTHIYIYIFILDAKEDKSHIKTQNRS